MKLLITGSAGNVGYFLIKYFVSKHIPVTGLDVVENSNLKPGKYFKFIRASVTDQQELNEIFTKEKPTHVIHLAYLMKSIHNTVKEHEIDVTGSENAINAANETRSVKQFIEFASTSAYGGRPDNKLWIKETQELRPGGYRYGINKKEVEEFINKFHKRQSLKFVIVRMCTAIGPSEYKKGGLVELMVRSPFLVKFDGKYVDLQLIHEHDLTALIHMIVKDRSIKGTYNLVPDDYSSIRALVPGKRFLSLPLGIVKAFTGILWALGMSGFMPAAIDLSAYGIVADPAKLQKRYRYKFKYTTLTGFRDAVEGMKKSGLL
jgi:nucleoside-diphosphate-sugar epimerase